MRPPFKVFDNLYWLGTRQHSSWALQTSAGIIIIDTNFAWATRPEIIDGMTKLGLNPNDIKYVIISHAHGDHDQGAAELQERYSAQVVMGAARLGRHAQASADCGRRSAEERHLGRAGGQETHVGRHDDRDRRDAGPLTRDVVVCVPGEGSGSSTMMVAYSGGTLTGAFGTDGAAVGRIHRVAAKDRQGSRRCGRQRAAVEPQRVRRRIHQGAPAVRAAPARRKPSVHRRRGRRAALLYGDDGVRDGVEAAGRREVALLQERRD